MTNGVKTITSGIFIYKCELNGQEGINFSFLKQNIFVGQGWCNGGDKQKLGGLTNFPQFSSREIISK